MVNIGKKFIFKSWEENTLHANKMKSPLDRTFYRHTYRDKDFNIWSQPTQKEKINSLNLPLSIFEPGILKDSIEKQVSL